jgi:phospholipid/cholesterol/gamma-HCH transport system ATP-binding protein
MIEVQNLRKSFDNTEVLKGISTTFETGKVNLVIGQSGSGKTVFLKSLLNVYEPSEGHILFDGRDIVGMGRKEKEQLRSEIGTVFQGSALFDSMTVQDNIMFPLDMFTNLTFTEKKKRVREVMGRVHLENAEKKIPFRDFWWNAKTGSYSKSYCK